MSGADHRSCRRLDCQLKITQPIRTHFIASKMGNANKRARQNQSSKKLSPVESITSGSTSPAAVPPSTPVMRAATRWSDIAAGRKSTHPDAAPIKRILDIPELCEQVLLHLPPRDLIHARGVCHTFRDLIDKTKPLQRALFLQVDQTACAPTCVLNEEGKLLAGETAQKHIKAMGARGIYLTSFPVYAINPLLLDKDIYANDTLDKRTARFAKERYGHPAFLLRNHLETGINKEASCWKMKLTCPPITKVKVKFWGRFRHRPWEDRRGLSKSYHDSAGEKEVENEEGLTFEDLFKAIQYPGPGCGIYCELGRPQFDMLKFEGAFAAGLEEVDEIEGVGS